VNVATKHKQSGSSTVSVRCVDRTGGEYYSSLAVASVHAVRATDTTCTPAQYAKLHSVKPLSFAALRILPNSVALVRERTIPTERPLLVGEVSANFFG
jgi:hypothetical protein